MKLVYVFVLYSWWPSNFLPIFSFFPFKQIAFSGPVESASYRLGVSEAATCPPWDVYLSLQLLGVKDSWGRDWLCARKQGSSRGVSNGGALSPSLILVGHPVTWDCSRDPRVPAPTRTPRVHHGDRPLPVYARSWAWGQRIWALVPSSAPRCFWLLPSPSTESRRVLERSVCLLFRSKTTCCGITRPGSTCRSRRTACSRASSPAPRSRWEARARGRAHRGQFPEGGAQHLCPRVIPRGAGRSGFWRWQQTEVEFGGGCRARKT